MQILFFFLYTVETLCSARKKKKKKNPEQPQPAAQMSVWCLADREKKKNWLCANFLFKLIHSAKYLALQTVFTFCLCA